MPRRKELDRHRPVISDDQQKAVLNRLKTARGHIDHVITEVERGAYAIDALRQIAAIRGALDATVRVLLRFYFEGAFLNAVKAGDAEPAIEELTQALAFLKQID
jgi:DNA-binding FrmR family transcriptional regulator